MSIKLPQYRALLIWYGFHLSLHRNCNLKINDMTLLKVKPRHTNAFSSEFDTLVDNLLYKQKKNVEKEIGYTPKANIIEDEKEYLIQLSLAGYNKKDIEINVEKGILKIRGSKKSTEENNSSKYHLRQLNDGKFSRSFYFPEEILEESINAAFENGLLELHIPKVEHKSLRRSVKIA